MQDNEAKYPRTGHHIEIQALYPWVLYDIQCHYNNMLVHVNLFEDVLLPSKKYFLNLIVFFSLNTPRCPQSFISIK